jgi:polysaccharide biosynthesis/export protein
VAAVLALALLGGCAATLDNPQSASLGSAPAGVSSPLATKTLTASAPAAPGAALVQTSNEATQFKPSKPDVASGLPTAKSGFQQTGSPKAVGVATGGSATYQVGALDLLEVAVYKAPELARTVQVAENGAVNLPLIGETRVAGMTAQEIERDLAKRLGEKYLNKPQVSVSVKEFNSQRVTVEGAVKTPGGYPLKGKTSLLQLIASTGGMTEVAENEVIVVRFVDGKRMAAKFDMDEVRGGQKEDPTLVAGDMVIVGTSAIKNAFNNLIKTAPLASVFRIL